MKKRNYILLLAVLASFVGGVASAQEEDPAQYKLYGFIRNYTVFDTHEVNAGTQDLYFYMPKDGWRRMAAISPGFRRSGCWP